MRLLGDIVLILEYDFNRREAGVQKPAVNGLHRSEKSMPICWDIDDLLVFPNRLLKQYGGNYVKWCTCRNGG